MTAGERIANRLGDRFQDLGRVTDIELAAAVGLSRERIRQYRRILHVPKCGRRLPPVSPGSDEVLRRWNDGESSGVIALAMGLTPNRVWHLLKCLADRGVEVRVGPSAKTRAKKGKWTAERAALLAKRWAEGILLAKLAVEFGLSRASLGQRICKLRKAGYDLPRRKRTALRGFVPREKRPLAIQIAALWREGKTGSEIAVVLGRSAPSIYTMVSDLRRRGVDLPRRSLATSRWSPAQRSRAATYPQDPVGTRANGE